MSSVIMSADRQSPVGASGEAVPARRRTWLRSAAFFVVVILLWAGVLELFLRVADFRALRILPESGRLPYEHDPELGWLPIANKIASGGVRLNSLGLRDIEITPTQKPTILFVGDSFVYGLGVKDGERFTDRLRERLPDFRIANAGVAAYGTDQAYLLLRRLWPTLKPRVVMLIVCVENDHNDNSTNSVHGHTFKPYLAPVGGEWKFQGIPVPRNHRWYYRHNWLAARSALVRGAILAYMYVRYPKVVVPDPTGRLVGMMRDYVEAQGAIFLVGLQHHDRALEPHLISRNIPYTRLGDAEIIPGDGHWNPRGHITVAKRILDLFAAQKVIEAAASKP
jgi:hypothetical protein